MACRKAQLIPDELLDQLLAGHDPQPALGRDGLLDELRRALAFIRAPRSLKSLSEMSHPIGEDLFWPWPD